MGYYMVIICLLLDNTLFEVFCEVSAYFGSGTLCSDLGHITFNHNFDQFLK